MHIVRTTVLFLFIRVRIVNHFHDLEYLNIHATYWTKSSTTNEDLLLCVKKVLRVYHLHSYKPKPEAGFNRFSRSFRTTYKAIHKQLKASKKRYLEHGCNEKRRESSSINCPNVLLNHSIKQSSLPIHVSNYHKTLITAISTSLEV